MALDGVKCRGYDTRQAREEDYCGYWESTSTRSRLVSDLRQELLEVGPHCVAESGRSFFAHQTRRGRSGLASTNWRTCPETIGTTASRNSFASA